MGSENKELNDVHFTFIGCGVMAESMIAGLLRKNLVGADQISGSHPRAARRREPEGKYAVRLLESNAEAAENVVEATGAAVVSRVERARRSRGHRVVRRPTGQVRRAIA